ncbi:uncharacterized protein LOC126968748 [Leptidea sinapis]|uniref:uncharacterized protein LOC126968748 n=1 Tax=Leptidea sinapis TaxID=189913 RepID=UPI00213F6951|nr:uncharacterized protein LOC126968748 [Leptidea sinapis]
MALMKSSQIPEDAVVLTEHEATEYVWSIVYNWEPVSDVWALRSGAVCLGVINAVSGAIMNRHYRNKLKLGTYGYFSSVIPLTLMPGSLTALFHRYIVSSDLLLLKNNHCPICYEVRSGAVQVGLGLVYPMILAPLTSLMLTNKYNTARIPEITQPKALLQLVRKMTRPFTGTLAVISIIQVVASSIITYFEVKNSLILHEKMLEIERKAVEKYGK